MESLTSGTLAGTGTFRCEICGHVVEMTKADVLPSCPGCDGASFTRASLFAGTSHVKSPVATGADVDAIAAARAAIEAPGRYLIFQDAGSVRTVAVEGASMRVGRSLSAHLRFEDPTVSRRHAVLVAESDGVRLLDDRSLNGVFVNGRRVVSHVLADGDEIIIGRHRLRFAELPAVAAQAAAAHLSAE